MGETFLEEQRLFLTFKANLGRLLQKKHGVVVLPNPFRGMGV